MAVALCIMGKTLGPEVAKQLSAHVALTGKAARQGKAFRVLLGPVSAPAHGHPWCGIALAGSLSAAFGLFLPPP